MMTQLFVVGIVIVKSSLSGKTSACVAWKNEALVKFVSVLSNFVSVIVSAPSG